MRNIFVTLGSLALTGVVIGNAYYQKKQFYPSVVYITKSNPSVAILYMQAFVLVLLFGRLMKRIFFGELRAAEFEHLMERAWYAVTETCLAFTVFKDDFNPKFVAFFTILLFLKSFHWLAEDRVDFMERSPTISWIFHIRIFVLMLLLTMLDLSFIATAYYYTLAKGPTVQMVFGFEYAILTTVVLNIMVKYALHSMDMNRDVFWENKAVFLLYVELIIGFCKVCLYTFFFLLMIRLYALPLFTLRPMYHAIKNFKKAFHDVVQSRRAIRNMNTLYPDATEADLAASDNTCIICREEMQQGAKKLPCNHIFHSSCLRSWFQRHQTCPTCRLNILRPIPERRPNAPPPPQLVPPPQAPPPPAFGMWQQLFRPPIPTRPPAPNANNSAGPSTFQPPPLLPNAFAPPPFPMHFMWPPMPFIPASVSTPLIPPEDLTPLTNEELAIMEEDSRRGAEARLACLRRIHLLLDASTKLMQQYATAAHIPPSDVSSSSTNSWGGNVAPKSEPGPSHANDGPSVSSVKPPKNESIPVKTNESTPIPSTSGTSNMTAEEASSEQERLRLKRLEKFDSSG